MMPQILGIFTDKEKALEEIKKCKITDNGLFKYGTTNEFINKDTNNPLYYVVYRW